MATKILAIPMDDKRKASSVDLTFTDDGGTVAGYTDIVDIRGFANFTIMVTSALDQLANIMVNDSPDGTFSRLYALGSSTADAITSIPTDINRSYDVPELAGCHYLKIVYSAGTSDGGAITIMGKV
jgi:hypothetical protein